VGTWAVACALIAIALYPCVATELARSAAADRARRLERKLALRPFDSWVSEPSLNAPTRALEGLLASWETIGGCGAGSSTGGGGGVKWIGRSTTGGLFQLQTQASYMHLSDGYNLTLNTQITRDLTEKWNVGLSVPVLYKYYRDYYGLPVDVSNGGLGDISALLTRRFGEINDTSLTLSVGFPSGSYEAKYKNDPLTQEKQLGAGRFTGALMLDHTMDQQWGLIVLGSSLAYRGGENKLGNYRAPVGSVYGYLGYFLGPWVPSLGLTYQNFFGYDRDRGSEQEQRLMSVAGTVALEWSTDWLAILAGASLPYGFYSPHKSVDGEKSTLHGPGFQPWTVALGLSISPF
jgi:hypothetical protein